VLELGDAMVFPDMFDQGFDVAADCVEIGVTRTEYTGVSSPSSRLMTSHALPGERCKLFLQCGQYGAGSDVMLVESAWSRWR
jgi:hypothetical protein